MNYLDIIKKLDVNVVDFGQLYAITLGSVYAVQQSFEENVVKGQKTGVNFQESKIKFGEDLFDVQYIGCDAEKKAWLWGWDEKSNFPASLFDLSNKMKQFGIDNEALYCKNPKYDLPNENFGRLLSGAMSALFNVVYHRVSTEKGGLYMAVMNAPEVVFEKVDEFKFVNISKHCLQTNNIDHFLFLEGFLLWNGITYTKEDKKMVVNFPREITINFNADNKVETMNVAEAK